MVFTSPDGRISRDVVGAVPYLNNNKTNPTDYRLSGNFMPNAAERYRTLAILILKLILQLTLTLTLPLPLILGGGGGGKPNERVKKPNESMI